MPYMTPIDAYRQAETFKAEQQQNALANLMNQSKLRQAAQQEQDQVAMRDMLTKASAEPSMDYGSLGRKMLAVKPDTGFELIKMAEGQRAQQEAAKRLSALGGGQGALSAEGGQTATGGVFESWMQHPNPGIKAMAKQGALLAQSGGFKDVADLNAYVQKMGEFDARFNDAQSSAKDRVQAQENLARMNFNFQKALVGMRGDLSQQGKWSYDAARGLAINTATGEARPIMQDGTPIGEKKAAGKILPTSAAQKLIENNQNMRRAEQALALVQGKSIDGMSGDTEATGWKAYLPTGAVDRFDPKGVDTRAVITDLGSLVVHDRSGAAVTAAEQPRLRPFIPSMTDDQETVKKKLARFASEYKALTEETAEFYKESGYKIPDVLKKAGSSDAGSPSTDTAPKPRIGEIQDGYLFNGGDPANPKSWKKVR